MELRIQYAKTSDGVNIAYAQFGEGVPLVYAPGAYGMGVHYYTELPYSRGNVDSLVAKGFRVIRYDARGTGSSDRDNLDYSLDTAVLDLEAVVERLELDPFVLVGHFQSARAAIAYAVGHPERLTHLVLRDPTTSAAGMDAIFPGSAIIDAMLPLAAEHR
jgi:pimeloyl-ACP methyl ester carboxylesterase